MSDFDPIVEEERGPRQLPVETRGLPPNGMLIIKFRSPAKKGSQVQADLSIVPGTQTDKHPFGVSTCANMSKVSGDTANSKTGTELRLLGMVGGQRGYQTLDADTDYYVNAWYADRTDPEQPDLRVQLTFTGG